MFEEKLPLITRENQYGFLTNTPWGYIIYMKTDNDVGCNIKYNVKNKKQYTEAIYSSKKQKNKCQIKNYYTKGQKMQKCCEKRKIRSDEEIRLLQNRLKRIEGQIRGISGMVLESAYCTDILTQVSAVQAAISAFANELLKSHIKSCVTEDIKNGKEETVDVLLWTIKKFLK